MKILPVRPPLRSWLICSLGIAGTILGASATLRADDLSVTGNLTVTGVMDISGNSFTLGPSQLGWPTFSLSYGDTPNQFLAFAAGRGDMDWVWLHPDAGDGSVTRISMRVDRNHRLTLYHNPGVDNDPGIVLDPSGVSSFTGSISVGGANNVMPNQTMNDSTSILTAGLGDARYVRTGMGGYNFGTNSTANGVYATTVGQFNAASGDYSTAVGARNTAAGYASFAGGQSSNANGGYSLAYGYTSSANTGNSVALGNSSTAGLASSYSDSAIALGYANTADAGYGVTAIGMNTYASGSGSVALGNGTSATGGGSFAAGAYSTANSEFAVAIGLSTVSDSWASVALGGQAESHAHYAISAGHGTIAQGESQAIFGEFNIAQGSDWYDPNDNLFVLGNGTDANHRSNAFVVKKTGDTEIFGKVTADTDVAVTGQLTVTAGGRFNGPVRIAPQGDIDMGAFTHEPGQ
ncbi:MAG: hypothetical protein P4L99_07045 [Chthoniobacter sp.]|nr:hypothetical protein [Chthoniobacter sp.]